MFVGYYVCDIISMFVVFMYVCGDVMLWLYVLIEFIKCILDIFERNVKLVMD